MPDLKANIIIRAKLRTMGALSKQQELSLRSRQVRTSTPAGPRENIIFVEHVAISENLNFHQKLISTLN